MENYQEAALWEDVGADGVRLAHGKNGASQGIMNSQLVRTF